MKVGRSLQELAAEIERQGASKRDLVADTRSLRMGDDLTLSYRSEDGSTAFEPMPVRELAHAQIAERVGIPAKYASRLRGEARELYARNVNHWFDATPQRRMVRTMDGAARAFLSDRYQRIDNTEVAGAIFPAFAEHPGLQIVSCEITESKLYIKATTARITGEVRKGDIVQAGLLATNSEIGSGAVSVQPLAMRLVCLNGMVIPDSRFRAHHVGGRVGDDTVGAAWLSDEAIAADDRAILLKLRDIVRGTLSQEVFSSQLTIMQDSTTRKLEGDPVRAIEVLGETVGLGVAERGNVLRHLIEGGDLSQWGVANAVTRYSADVESYDRASELEEIGGRIITLPANQWRRVAEAQAKIAA